MFVPINIFPRFGVLVLVAQFLPSLGHAHSGIQVYRREMSGPFSCTPPGSRSEIDPNEDIAIVSPAIVHTLLGSDASDSQIVCLSIITLAGAKSGQLVQARIVGFCDTCTNNTIYISPSAYAKFEEPSNPLVSVSDAWIASVAYTPTYVREAVYDQLRKELRTSASKNTLRLHESCNATAEMERLNVHLSNYSLSETSDLVLQEFTEITQRLMRTNSIPGQFCSVYQNLVCGNDSKCNCRSVDLPSDPRDILGCINDITKLNRACILDFPTVSYQRLGLVRTIVSSECWMYDLCSLTTDGARCEPVYNKTTKRMLMTLDPDGKDATALREYMLRLEVKSSEGDSLDCVCMDPLVLKSFSSLAQVLFTRLSIFSKRNHLQRGSVCNTSAEELKSSNLGKLSKLDGPLDPTLHRADVYDKLSNERTLRSLLADGLKWLLYKNATFCTTYKNLYCNAFELCDCHPNPAPNVELVWDAGSSTCVLRRNSVCDPAYWRGRFESYVDPYEEDAEPPPCEHDLPCIDRKTGALCPRNNTSGIRVSFKDKIFPFLNPKFKTEEFVNPGDYCRCGHDLKVKLTGLSQKLVIFGAVPLVVLLLVATGVAIWYQRRLRASRNRIAKMEYNFRKGNPELRDGVIEDGAVVAQGLAYDHEKYEIPKGYIHYGEDKGIAGCFGIVQKGTIRINGQERVVAIKKCKDANNLNQANCIHTEIKILSYVGKHENVVELICAYTKEFERPEMMLEYCDRGSLLKFLKGNRSTFLDQIVDDRVDVVYFGSSIRVTQYDRPINYFTTNLVRWSLQIANGMEYLSGEKHVIHGDLLLKNIVMTVDGIAKITDFGLSRQYKPGEPYYNAQCLPEARLLPPEVRDRKSLRPQMDVWTFGVLLWEMFTLGREPDCVLSATELAKPQYMTTDMYELTRRCWAEDPDARVRFGELKDGFGVALRLDGDDDINASFDFAIKFMPQDNL